MRSHNIHFYSLVLTISELIVNLHGAVGYIQAIDHLLAFSSGKVNFIELLFF